MRLFSNLGLLTVLGLALGLAPAVAEENEEKIPLDHVPKAVMDAVKGRFAGAIISGASKEVENGMTFFELSLTHNKQKTDVLARPDGTIVEIEREISLGALPAVITTSVKSKYPGATLKTAEEKTEGTKVSYEVIIETGDKTKREISLDRLGMIVEDEAVED